ncbi:hypothetical protein [Mycolicibacterium llatzerense]|uniref:hypothetical protein n=1 Tax=Mycolicibacterium llatzerense TaxID=280871 RepID=UPI0021B69D61|nr:hypothetical protein [Mycolicibacterium llatzerense]MCT7361252.1 hypothetical protein [Mycolicibacterium llatzerense]
MANIRDMNTDDQFDLWPLILGNLLLAVIVWLLVVGVFGAIAALVAPRDRRLVFFLLTFFLFGPFGIALAAIANSREPSPPAGMRDQFCRRCVARNMIANDDDNYQCWRCGRDHGVLPKK